MEWEVGVDAVGEGGGGGGVGGRGSERGHH